MRCTQAVAESERVQRGLPQFAERVAYAKQAVDREYFIPLDNGIDAPATLRADLEHAAERAQEISYENNSLIDRQYNDIMWQRTLHNEISDQNAQIDWSKGPKG